MAWGFRRRHDREELCDGVVEGRLATPRSNGTSGCASRNRRVSDPLHGYVVLLDRFSNTVIAAGLVQVGFVQHLDSFLLHEFLTGLPSH